MTEKEAGKAETQAAPLVVQMHKPPSMLWFVIPLGLLLAYALFTR